jgi:hypothetical protein
MGQIAVPLSRNTLITFTWRSPLGSANDCESIRSTGEALEQLELPPGTGMSGLESDGADQFFCGGGSSGTVRAVRRPGRGSGAGSGSKTRVEPTRKSSKRR